MNVYLDGSWLASGIGVTGIRRFSAEVNDAVLNLFAASATATTPRVFSIGAQVEAKFRRPGVEYSVVPWDYRYHLWANAFVGRPNLANKLEPKPDRIHFHDAVKFSGGGRDNLVTVQDLASLREADTYPARSVWLRRRSLRRLRDSDAIVHTISDATRSDVIAIGRIPPERVHTVHCGVHPSFFVVAAEAGRKTVLKELGLERPYLLYIGGHHPRKNLPFLVSCFREVLRRGRDVELVLVGPGRAGSVDEWCRVAGYTGEERKRVRYLGSLPDENMRILLQSSRAFCFPSRYEGFGLPVLEAMASGTPVVASDRSSLPEVLGECGFLLDPDVKDGWVGAIDQLVASDALCARLGELGRGRAALFTWEKAARGILSLMDIRIP